jgi:hypothetical protein
VAVLAVAGGLYWLGGRDARRDAERDAIKARIEHIEQREERRDEIKNLSDDDLRDRLIKRLPRGGH